MRRRLADCNTKSPAKRPGFDSTHAYAQTYLAGVGLGDVGLERLVGLLGEIGIELADLGRLGDEAFVGGLGVVGLDLDRLVERLGAEQLLDDLGAVLERLLRVVGDFGRDRLARSWTARRTTSSSRPCCLCSIFCTSSKFLIIVVSLRPAACGGTLGVTCLDLARSTARMRGNILHCTKKARLILHCTQTYAHCSETAAFAFDLL